MERSLIISSILLATVVAWILQARKIEALRGEVERLQIETHLLANQQFEEWTHHLDFGESETGGLRGILRAMAGAVAHCG